jgi:hypothetical protein
MAIYESFEEAYNREAGGAYQRELTHEEVAALSQGKAVTVYDGDDSIMVLEQSFLTPAQEQEVRLLIGRLTAALSNRGVVNTFDVGLKVRTVADAIDGLEFEEFGIPHPIGVDVDKLFSAQAPGVEHHLIELLARNRADFLKFKAQTAKATVLLAVGEPTVGFNVQRGNINVYWRSQEAFL